MDSYQITLIVLGLIPGACIGAGIVLFGAMKKNGSDEEHDSIKNTSFVFSGNLRQTNLLEAVQFLEIGRREGILHIYTGRRKGYLIFSRGRVIDAFFRNKTGREGLFAMLDLDEGDFYFEPKTIRQPRIIADSIMDIAFEYDEMKNGGAPQQG